MEGVLFFQIPRQWNRWCFLLRFCFLNRSPLLKWFFSFLISLSCLSVTSSATGRGPGEMRAPAGKSRVKGEGFRGQFAPSGLLVGWSYNFRLFLFMPWERPLVCLHFSQRFSSLLHTYLWHFSCDNTINVSQERLFSAYPFFCFFKHLLSQSQRCHSL